MHIILKVILHLFFWIVFFVLSGVMSFQMSEGPEFMIEHIEALVIATAWAAVAFYFFYFFMYRFIEKHRFLKYFIYSVISVVGISLVFITFTRIFIFNGKFNVETSWNYTTMAGTYIIANCGSLLKGFIGWIESTGIRTELEKRNLKLELEALRSQINPHFLFNTLNNIDALIHTQPQKASTMLITLSDVMRYMLYQTQGENTTIALEANHLQNVLSLQKIRFSEPNYIQYKFDIKQNDKQIAPLLFIPFVENACKYAHYNGLTPIVDVNLQQSDNIIKFECTNSYDPKKESKKEMGGLGLENVKKRLTLLYPQKHELTIRNEGNIFSVSLIIGQ